MKNLAKKGIANSMRKIAEQELTKLNEKPNSSFTLVKFMNKDGKDIEGERYMKGKDGKSGFREKNRKRIWKNQMEEIMNKENNWNRGTETGMIEEPIKNVTREDMAIAIKAMKPGRTTGPCAEMVSVNGKVGISVMMEL